MPLIQRTVGRMIHGPGRAVKRGVQNMTTYIRDRAKRYTDNYIDSNVEKFTNNMAEKQQILQRQYEPSDSNRVSGGKRNSAKLYTKKYKKKIDGVVKVIYSKKKSKKLYVKSKGKMINLVKYEKMKKNKKIKNKK